MKVECAVLGCEETDIDMFLKASPIALISLCSHHRGVVQQMLHKVIGSNDPSITILEEIGFHFE